MGLPPDSSSPALPYLDVRAALSSWAHRRRWGLRHLVVEKIRFARQVEHLATEDRLDAAITAERRDLVEEVAWVARPERTADRQGVPPLKIGGQHRGVSRGATPTGPTA